MACIKSSSDFIDLTRKIHCLGTKKLPYLSLPDDLYTKNFIFCCQTNLGKSAKVFHCYSANPYGYFDQKSIFK